jgi:hypothetical protein
MAVITLTRKKVELLHAFCIKHKKETFFVAKDQGAYVGSSVGEGNNCIYYFPGCDPVLDKDWYDTAHDLFGGDDFGDYLPVEWLQKVVDNPLIAFMKIKVSKKQITADFILVKQH